MATRKPAARKQPKPPEFKVQAGWLPKNQMAKALGISVQAFDKWDVEPVAKHGREVFFSVLDVVRFREQRAADAERRKWQRYVGTDPGDSPEAIQLATVKAELRLTEERAETQRLKNAELRRELAPVEMLTWALGDLASQVVPLLTPIPGEIKRRIPKVTNAELHMMREVIANALNLVAEVRLDFDAYEPESEPGSD